MNRIAMRMTRALGDDETEHGAESGVDAAGAAEDATAQADYSFEGYSAEFLDKVALLPIAPVPPSTR
jgi:hypothetical protein